MTENEIIRLAQKLNLGRIVPPIGLDAGDVFYTDNSYRTAELLAFADAMQSHGYAEGRSDHAEAYKPLMQVVEWILDAGHMNQEFLSQLRSAWEMR